MMESPLDQKSLGLLVKERRKRAGVMQEAAAMLYGVTKKTFIRVEVGEDAYISTLFKILDGLGVRLAVLQMVTLAPVLAQALMGGAR